ncbi:hypothetical protein [Oceanisphaera sp.]|uniref:hypothetical protein n=1 Tax=Oceanisphaera sp. TaxID=1929979 RepID=UPI003A8FE626
MTNNEKVNIADLSALEYLSMIQDALVVSCLRGSDIDSLAKCVVFETLVGPRAIVRSLDWEGEDMYLMGIPKLMDMTGFIVINSSMHLSTIEGDRAMFKDYLPKGVTWQAVFSVAKVALQKKSIGVTSKVVKLPSI